MESGGHGQIYSPKPFIILMLKNTLPPPPSPHLTPPTDSVIHSPNKSTSHHPPQILTDTLLNTVNTTASRAPSAGTGTGTDTASCRLGGRQDKGGLQLLRPRVPHAKPCPLWAAAAAAAALWSLGRSPRRRHHHAHTGRAGLALWVSLHTHTGAVIGPGSGFLHK